MDEYEPFIRLVRKYPILYNAAHEDYNNLAKKHDVWIEIATTLQTNVTQCKKWWKGLRDSYTRCKRKKEPKPKWRYYKSMSFLEDVQHTRPEIIFNQFVEKIPDSPTHSNDENDDLMEMDNSNTRPLTPESFQSLKKNSDNTLQNEDDGSLKDFVQLTSTSNKQQRTLPIVEKEDNELTSTSLLFSCLARKIREANLPLNVMNKIEAKVSSIVFLEILKYQNTLYGPTAT